MNRLQLIHGIVFFVQYLSTQAYSENSSIFLLYPSLNLCVNTSLSIEFRPSGSNGLLFYTKDHQTNDSILVRLEQKKLVYEQIIAKQKFIEQWDQILYRSRWYQFVLHRRSSQIFEIKLSILNSEILGHRRIIRAYPQASVTFVQSNNIDSFVYVRGVPWKSSDRSFRGSIQNVRYSSCGCISQFQYPIFSPLFLTLSHRLLPLPCHLSTDDVEDNRMSIQIDFTSKDHQSLSTFGTDVDQLHVFQPGGNRSETILLLPNYLNQTDTCLWNLNRCWSGLSLFY